MANWAWPLATVISVIAICVTVGFVFYLANKDKED